MGAAILGRVPFYRNHFHRFSRSAPLHPQHPSSKAYTDLHTGRFAEHNRPVVNCDHDPAPKHVADSDNLPVVDGGEPAIVRYENRRHPGHRIFQQRRQRPADFRQLGVTRLRFIG